MKPAVKIPIACLLFLATEIFAQDVKPEVPVDIPPEGWEPTIPTTEALATSTVEPSTTSTTEPTTIPTTEPSTTLITGPTTTSATEPTITSTTESTTTSTTESTTTSTTEPTTTSTTEPFTTSTTETLTTSTTDSTTTSTTKRTLPSSTQPTTPSTTQGDPLYPTYRPIYTRPMTSRRPIYPTRNPWIWHDPTEKCYLKNEYEYRMVCYGGGWRTTAICYRCCYYENSGFAGCSKLHQGRCSWYDSGRW
ncbi:cell wall integrity and stress response component 3 [Drosophila elegans]|uniref:cell wall integrity and stress response component 3 n=1 Tax=Drosophila elegans TaxID=30023 RepID=UPI0007E6343F|nr:cell wall integrity and stress response component 3 [Drosophila elegans]